MMTGWPTASSPAMSLPVEPLASAAMMERLMRRPVVVAPMAGGPTTVDLVIAASSAGAFLRCPESGAHPLHKAALADPRFTRTAITRAFSGRPARGLVNRFMLDHPDAPCAYPEINSATRPLRAAAVAAGDVDRTSLWAGEGFRAATARPAAEVVELLWPGPTSRNTSLPG